ncbi:fatty-acid peroxygenase [Pilimelia terevasa]|uniref:Fatty-acid peroxygenase n=1 Tax=Pilimelia terevasa TaxID=53372 RepID=A0A8J3BR63_9ACTN|nr:cytochrome P450 [Pilimelia terevasa]GGK21849.1 fatty-acid peroxygenase [Pilimelia terevasa]
MDHTLDALVDGYAWLPALRRRQGSDIVETRVLGRRAVALSGPGAAEFFVDDRDIVREGVVPAPVRATLFGFDSVHGLDGPAHRHRKRLFLAVLPPERVDALVAAAGTAWDRRVAAWTADRTVSLHEEAAAALTDAVCDWAGVPVGDHTADDLVAMIDGFATLGPRHWRARRARRRQEARLAGLVAEVRVGVHQAAAGTALAAVAHHREPDGSLLDQHTAAVELLNVLRPTVATAWLVMFAGHALHRWPRLRDRLAEDPGYATAFAHEVRRFYPFAPYVGGRAARELHWHGQRIRPGTLVLLDIFGQNHDPVLWPAPYEFRPERFAARGPGDFDLVAQGAGDPETGHRCPGEPAVVRLLAMFARRLATLEYAVPGNDLDISLRRIPARVADGMTIRPVPARVAAAGVTGSDATA